MQSDQLRISWDIIEKKKWLVVYNILLFNSNMMSVSQSMRPYNLTVMVLLNNFDYVVFKLKIGGGTISIPLTSSAPRGFFVWAMPLERYTSLPTVCSVQ